MQSASIGVNARLAGSYSASGRLLCRDALGAAEIRRAYLNERFLWDRVTVPRKRGGQTASAPASGSRATLEDEAGAELDAARPVRLGAGDGAEERVVRSGVGRREYRSEA